MVVFVCSHLAWHRAWDDYIDYAAYVTGERDISTTSTAAAGAVAVTDAVGVTVSVHGDAMAVTGAGDTEVPAVTPPDAVVAPTKPRSGFVRSLMERKSEAMASVIAKRRVGEEKEADKEWEESRSGRGRSGSGGRAGNVQPTSFTVDDSDAVDTPWTTTGGVNDAVGEDDEDERELPSDAAAIGILDGIDDDEGDKLLSTAASDDDDDFRFLDSFLQSRSATGSSASGEGITTDLIPVRAAAVLGALTAASPASPASAASAANLASPAPVPLAEAATDRESRARAVDEALRLLGLSGSDAPVAALTMDLDIDFSTGGKKQREARRR